MAFLASLKFHRNGRSFYSEFNGESRYDPLCTVEEANTADAKARPQAHHPDPSHRKDRRRRQPDSAARDI